MTNWNKIELYDDLFPWAIKSEDGKWIITKDSMGNVFIFSAEQPRNKMIKFFPSDCDSPVQTAKEACEQMII